MARARCASEEVLVLSGTLTVDTEFGTTTAGAGDLIGVPRAFRIDPV
jgi:ethanolamine utilization protein EutQ (cupin superfamily)